MIKTVESIATLSDDKAISEFMETHEGVELVNQGLAELEEPPTTFTRGKSYIEVDPETFRLLDNLVTSGACPDIQHALHEAVHSYMHTVLP